MNSPRWRRPFGARRRRRQLWEESLRVLEERAAQLEAGGGRLEERVAQLEAGESRLEALETISADLDERGQRAAEDFRALGKRADALGGELSVARAEGRAATDRAAAATDRAAAATSTAGRVEAALAVTAALQKEELDRLRQEMEVWHTTAWVGAQPVGEQLLISVVLPARDRPAWLRRAMASVVAQSYPTWELIVVDEGQGSDPTGVVADAADGRIRVVQGARSGPDAARCRGLEAAQGQLVTYLDDETAMAPHWLRSLAWAWSRWPETPVFYGAWVATAPAADAAGAELGPFTMLHSDRIDLDLLDATNRSGLCALAHRRDLTSTLVADGAGRPARPGPALSEPSRRLPRRLPVLAGFSYGQAAAAAVPPTVADFAAAHARMRAKA